MMIIFTNSFADLRQEYGQVVTQILQSWSLIGLPLSLSHAHFGTSNWHLSPIQADRQFYVQPQQ